VEVIENLDNVFLKTEESKVELINESSVTNISKEEVQTMVKEEVQRLIPQLTESILINVSKSTGSKIPQKPETGPSDVVHEHVSCDGCGISPIVGFRYKCIVCHNFDFCEKCEGEGKHPHAFIKIRNPSQVPRVLITSEEDVNPGVNINGQNLNFKDLLSNPGPAIGIANSLIPGLNLTEEKVKGFCDKFKNHAKEGKDRHCKFGRFSEFLNGIIPGFGSQTQEEKPK